MLQTRNSTAISVYMQRGVVENVSWLDLTSDPKGVARQWLADISYSTSSEPSDGSH